jgi:hypothetical protein
MAKKVRDDEEFDDIENEFDEESTEQESVPEDD